MAKYPYEYDSYLTAWKEGKGVDGEKKRASKKDKVL